MKNREALVEATTQVGPEVVTRKEKKKKNLKKCFSNCGPRTTGSPRRFRKESIAKNVSDTERMINIYACLG
jgi:hypothetical protein